MNLSKKLSGLNQITSNGIFSFIRKKNNIYFIMRQKPLFQKKIGTAFTLSIELLNRLDQSRGQVPRSTAVESILRQHFNLSAIGREEKTHVQ